MLDLFKSTFKGAVWFVTAIAGAAFAYATIKNDVYALQKDVSSFKSVNYVTRDEFRELKGDVKDIRTEQTVQTKLLSRIEGKLER